MRRRRIAVFMASVDREYQQIFSAGLAAAGRQYDMDLCIFNSQGHPNEAIRTNEGQESAIYELFDPESFDGAISLLATMGNDQTSRKVREAISRVQRRGMPHVSMDVPVEGAVTLCFDDRGSVIALTEHLIEKHGVQSVAFVSGPLISGVSQERLRACRDALAAHGLALEEELLFDGQWTRIGGREAALQMLNRGGKLPDAVICANDDMALSVMETFQEHGIRVPEDVRVTGFDALREAVMRGLTTISRPIDQSARLAMEILWNWLEGREPTEWTRILKTNPVYGNSCGCFLSLEQKIEKLRGLERERGKMESNMTRVSMFSDMMVSVSGEEETVESMREFVRGWELGEFFLCIDPAICRDGFEQQSAGIFPDRMLLLYGTREDREEERQLFDRHELAPVLQQMREKPVCLVFCPLYYRDRELGYVAMGLGPGTGLNLYSILMLLNSTLMVLYLQSSMRRYAETIERLVNHDIMTGMINRRGFMTLAPAVLEQARREGRFFVLISADMDHMKQINDEYGHLMGDEAICRMGEGMRVLESRNMTPVHISGDEFLAFGIADSLQAAEELVPLIHAELKRQNAERPWIQEITTSLGMYAAVPEAGEELDRFLTRADRAMYADKTRKKGRSTSG